MDFDIVFGYYGIDSGIMTHYGIGFDNYGILFDNFVIVFDNYGIVFDNYGIVSGRYFIIFDCYFIISQVDFDPICTVYILSAEMK